MPILTSEVAGAVLKKALSTGGDFAEIFAEDSLSNTITMTDGSVESAVNSRIYGAGIRILKGFQTVYACTNDLTLSGLLAAAENAAAAVSSLDALLSPALTDLTCRQAANIHPILLTPGQVDASRKLEVVKAAYHAMKEYSPEIVQGIVNLVDKDQQVTIVNSEGLFVQDRRIRTRLVCRAVASDGHENQVGTSGPGALMGFELFSQIDPADTAREAARQAVTMLHAGYCPAGQMPVAIENGFGGVIFHEACGHALESASVAKGHSVFAGKLGQQIASPLVTAIDDGTLPNRWGSVNIDDEGAPAQRNLLIEKGVLKGYMIDRLGSRRMGLPSTGSGRRESYRFAPTSRMTNTFIDVGTDTREEILSSMEYGLYARRMGGGQVNPITGEFNFAVTEGYLVRDGKICEPVRGASLIGKGAEVLMKIDRVSGNLELGQGMCGASSGSVPVNVGQPLIRVSEITVGGR